MSTLLTDLAQPRREPTATTGLVESSGNVSQTVQAAGRDINQSKIGPVSVHICGSIISQFSVPLVLISTLDNTKNITINLSPQADPEEQARIVRRILAESSDITPEDVPDHSLHEATTNLVYQDVIMKASRWDDIRRAVRTLKPTFASEGCRLVQLANSETGVGSAAAQLFRITSHDANDSMPIGRSREDTFGEPSPMADFDGSGVFTVSDGYITRKHSPIIDVSRNGATRHSTPSLTTGSESADEFSESTPESTPQQLPLTSEGKILHYSLEGWLEERDERLKLETKAAVERFRFRQWLLRHLFILYIIECLRHILGFYNHSQDEMVNSLPLGSVFDSDNEQEEYEEDLELEMPLENEEHDSESITNTPLWWLDPLTATDFQQWRNPLPQINFSYSESSSGSEDSAQRTPPSTDSSEEFYYDADRCNEPDEMEDVPNAAFMEEWIDEISAERGSSWANEMVQQEEEDGEREMSSEEVKELLGIPGERFGYPDDTIVAVRLGIRRVQTSRF
jgi:hypothetical protein